MCVYFVAAYACVGQNNYVCAVAKYFGQKPAATKKVFFLFINKMKSISSSEMILYLFIYELPKICFSLIICWGELVKAILLWWGLDQQVCHAVELDIGGSASTPLEKNWPIRLWSM